MKYERFSARYDKPTIVLYGLLVLFGWLNIYSAVYDPEKTYSIFNMTIESGRQLIFILAALVLIFVVSKLDLHFFNSISYLVYLITIALMVLVLFVGKEVGGNKAWLGVGSFGFQPSELAKLATALAVSNFIGMIGFNMRNLLHRMALFALIALPMGIVLLQKDTGTALVFLSFYFVLYREGLSPLLLIVAVVGGVLLFSTLLFPPRYVEVALVVLVAGVLYFTRKNRRVVTWAIVSFICMIGVVEGSDYFMKHVLKPHQQVRIKLLLNPDADPLGAGWNITQSKIAIGSGGFWGKGFLNGTQTKFKFVPEQSTDFIFCTIGEEYGWLGSIVIIGLFVALFLRLLFLAERQKTRQSRSFGYAVVATLFFHFTINIGMTIGLFPVIGIPLPFFSYGGSSLWSFTLLLFIFLKSDAHRAQVLQRL